MCRDVENRSRGRFRSSSSETSATMRASLSGAEDRSNSFNSGPVPHTRQEMASPVLVRRKRVQLAQNGCDADAMKPITPRSP